MCAEGSGELKLPRGVAIVRIREGHQRIVLVSKTLTHDQEIAARVLVAILAGGRPYGLLMTTDVVAAMAAAA